jgi:Protein of unknown function (DUF1579)
MAEKSKHEAEMEAYHKLAIPGAPHRLLASMAGSWTTMTKSWMEPGKPPMESAGTCEQKMILGGRYLYQEFSGDMMGMPFTGIGITGYDNHKQRYVSTWMDSMSTGIYFFEGLSGADDKTITMECRADDPVRGPMKWRSVTKILDHNTHRFKMYGTDKSDKEQKMMEITYSRK